MNKILTAEGLTATKNEQQIREEVQEEVWEYAKFLAGRINSMNSQEKWECWGSRRCNLAILKCSYSEAKARYEQWKAEKDEEEKRKWNIQQICERRIKNCCNCKHTSTLGDLRIRCEIYNKIIEGDDQYGRCCNYEQRRKAIFEPHYDYCNYD